VKGQACLKRSQGTYNAVTVQDEGPIRLFTTYERAVSIDQTKHRGGIFYAVDTATGRR